MFTSSTIEFRGVSSKVGGRVLGLFTICLVRRRNGGRGDFLSNLLSHLRQAKRFIRVLRDRNLLFHLDAFLKESHFLLL